MPEAINITDIDEILPPRKSVSFTADDGNKYTIPLFIPSAVALLIVEKADVVKRLFPSEGGAPQIDSETLETILRIFEIVCTRKYQHMTADWIDANIELPQLLVILLQLLKPLYEYFSNSGLAGMMAKP